MSLRELLYNPDATHTYNNMVGAAISGTFVCLYCSSVSVWKTSFNSEKYDRHYRVMMLANSYLMCYVFLALIISNFITEIDAVATAEDVSPLAVYVYELDRFDIFVLIITMQLLGIIHHTINIVRIIYEMKRDRKEFNKWVVIIAWILTIVYSLLLLFCPFIPFLVIFFQIDTIPHIIIIVLYYKLIYAVEKRGDTSEDQARADRIKSSTENELELAETVDKADGTAGDEEEEKELVGDVEAGAPVEEEKVPINDSPNYPTKFCCTQVFPGNYETNFCMIKRYRWAIYANLLHQFSGFIILGFRALGLPESNPIIKFNLDLIAGFGLIAASIYGWRQVIMLTPKAFSEKAKQ